MSWLGLRMVVVAVVMGAGACTAEPGGGSTSNGGSGSGSGSGSESATTMTTAGSSDSGGEAGCNGGPACGADEYCYDGGVVCNCTDNFQYCSFDTPAAGCTPVPDECTGMQGEAQQLCIAEQSCGVFPGAWVDGVLDCQTEECTGDCDLNPDACVDTSSGDAGSSGGSSSGGSSDGGSSGGSTGG